MKRAFEIELSNAAEAVDLIRRRPSYAKMVAGLYGVSLFGMERGRVLRAAYLPIRLIDDLLDGDAQGVNDPVTYARELSHRIVTDSLLP